MRRFTIRFIWMVVIAALVVGCGRRLPDEYFETNTSVTESDTPAEVADASETSDEASEDDEVSEEDTSAEAEATETADADEDTSADAETLAEEESEPEMVLVEVPADPIVELIANADAVNGETLFNSGVTCTSCHNVDSEDRLVGPGLLNIPQRAETRVEGEVAERYLYNAIILPNDHVVDGYPAAMYASYPADYTEEEIYDIVAYLMTLGDYPEREPVFMEVAAEDTDAVESVAGDADIVDEADDMAETEATEEAVADTESTEVVESTEEAVADTESPEVAEATEEAVADTESTEVAEATEVTPEVVVIVVTATPSAEVVADVESTEAVVDMTFEPAYTLDYSAVPQTINALAQYGSVSAGETVFSANCASCHTIDGTGDSDLSMVGSIEDAPSYIWAATYSEDVHGELATDFTGDITAADAAHLVAYLLSHSDAQSSDR